MKFLSGVPDYEVAEILRKHLWQTTEPENCVIDDDGKSGSVRLCYKVDSLCVINIVVVGPRKGLSEYLAVLDSSKTLTSDELVCNYYSEGFGSFGCVLPLIDLRSRCKGLSRNEVLDLVCERMTQVMAETQSCGRDSLLSLILTICLSFSESVTPIPGSYGTGKRSK